MFNAKMKPLILCTAALLGLGFMQPASATSSSASSGIDAGASTGTAANVSSPNPASAGNPSLGEKSANAGETGTGKTTGNAASTTPAKSANNPDVISGADKGVSSTIEKNERPPAPPITPFVVTPSR